MIQLEPKFEEKNFYIVEKHNIVNLMKTYVLSLVGLNTFISIITSTGTMYISDTNDSFTTCKIFFWDCNNHFAAKSISSNK